MPYVVAIVPHDFLGKMEMMCQCKTEAEARQIAAAKSPFAVAGGEPDNDERERSSYSAIIWEGTFDDSYEGKLGKPLALYYRGVEWTPDRG